MSFERSSQANASEKSIEDDIASEASQVGDEAETAGEDQVMMSPTQSQASNDSISNNSTNDVEEAQMRTWAAQRDAHYKSIGFSSRPLSDFHLKDPERFRHLDFIEAGARMQPSNGPDVKRGDGRERCMTCIRYEKTCFGTSVSESKCEQCRRNPDVAGSKDRRCIWMDDKKNIWNYKDGQEAAGFKGGRYKYVFQPGSKSTMSRHASRATSKSHQALTIAGFDASASDNDDQVQDTPAPMDPPPPPSQIDHIDNLVDARERNLVQWGAEQLLPIATIMEANEPLANLRLLSLTIEGRNPLAGITDGDFEERISETRAQLRVLAVLRRMRDSDAGLHVDYIDEISRWVREE